METPLKSFLLSNNNILNIYYSENHDNPQQEWDNLGHCEFFHRSYNFGNVNEFSSVHDARNYANSKDVISLPVYMYEHSGIIIQTNPFGDSWDSGLLGYIWVSKENVRTGYHVKRISNKLKEKVLSILISEIKLLNQYVSGEIYCFDIVDSEDNNIDSCSGFYGDNFKENGLFDHALDNNITVVKEIEVKVVTSLE